MAAKWAREAGLPVLATYGMTETTSQVATEAPAEAGARPGSAGRLLDGRTWEEYPA